MSKEPNKETVKDAIFKAKGEVEGKKIYEGMKWDSINGCWMVEWCGMWLGIETDGYMHT